ncbi:glutathione-S-transferase [Sistotremastrum niveocremeum HHB9708]|uniref:Glutathione-dependent dehydroascorbate reductase n=1 Tax=Sistotremastrum niveocremeum HHB9708 TaxID=1314777 RepID=A0A164NE71_9AGAM|nr:glutathione-S-transferase [Sistotremastrum niveocremeum HHB9708]
MAIPDADIYPTATGRALETVKQHQNSSQADIIFYAGWFCPFVQRVWIALEEKGISYEYREENPYHKDPEFLKISPKGLVPAIIYQGQPIHESLVILEFLEEAFPNTKPLLPADPYARSQIRLALDHISKSILPSFFKLLQSQDPTSQSTARESLYKSFSQFGDGIKGEYWAGNEISLADIALMPWAGRLYILEENREFDIERTGEKFKGWAQRIIKHPAMQNTASEREHYAQIYGRYLRDEAQSEAAKATRNGGVIP